MKTGSKSTHGGLLLHNYTQIDTTHKYNVYTIFFPHSQMEIHQTIISIQNKALRFNLTAGKLVATSKQIPNCDSNIKFSNNTEFTAFALNQTLLIGTFTKKTMEGKAVNLSIPNTHLESLPFLTSSLDTRSLACWQWARGALAF